VSTTDSPVTPISNEVKRFGTEIRRRRQSLDLSLADLADLVGLTSNFIGTIENGMRNPSISTVLSLARGLGAPPAELIAEAHGLGPPGLEVARLFTELSPVVQDRFIELLRLICIRQEAVMPAPGPMVSTTPAATPTPVPAAVPAAISEAVPAALPVTAPVAVPPSDTDGTSDGFSEPPAFNIPT
jgi:transcriptional regulator with XRE-family HTH domain